MNDKRQSIPSIDITLLASVVLLIGIGLGFLYSASQPSGVRYYDNQFYYIIRQSIYLAIGFFFFFVGAVVNHNIYRKYIKFLVVFTVILLILTLIPGIGKMVGGARRWLQIGPLRFQPSEIAKLTVILYLSSVLDSKKDCIEDFYKGVLPPMVIVGVFSFFIFLENDFSTTFIIILVSMTMLYMSGVRIFTFVMLLFTGLAGSVLMIFLAPYRVKRMFAFINPWNDPLDSGWHYIQSMKCFSLGSWFGRGIGESTQKYHALPEAYNDYIYAIIAEEGGAFIAVLIILIFTIFAFAGYNIAKRAENRYSFLLAVGITTMVYFQAVINIGVVLSLLPATGITLPFMSAGGTSLIIFMFMIGVLFNVSLVNRKKRRYNV